MTRYGDMSYVMHVDADMFVDLIAKAIEKNNEGRIWEKWLAEIPRMDEKNFIPWNKYLESHYKNDSRTNKTDEEILQDAENILKSMSEPS